ncbi:MAG TPA: Xaa-Pro peptidase family protein [Candidatus Binatia bacterium]
MADEPNFKQMQKDRVRQLQTVMKEQGFGALFLADGPNVRYVTNVKLPGGSVFVPREGEPILYSRSRDRGYVDREYPNVRPALRSGNATDDQTRKAARWAEDMKATMKEFGVAGENLGVDPLDVTSIHALAEMGIDVVDGRHALSTAKRVKTGDEIKCFRAMGHWYRDIMEGFRKAVRPGVPETELAAVVHYEAVKKGAEEIFQLNVCAGENMNPWRRWPSEREVEAEEFVGIDLHLIGPGGCWTDVSRTYYCGSNPTQEQKDLYKTAYDYLQGVIALLKPGERIDSVVARAPKIPEKYRELLDNYSIAHSDAMRPHEYPRIEKDKPVPDLLEPNMVFSVETYFSEVGAKDTVKLEELVAVTKSGSEVLSTGPFDERFI